MNSGEKKKLLEYQLFFLGKLFEFGYSAKS